MATKSAHRSKPTSARTAAKKASGPAQRAARTRAVIKRSATPQQRQRTLLSSSAAGAQVSKQARLIALLQSEPGATISQMRTLTGWQAHTVRGTISGALRKRLGLNVVCNAMNESGARIYRIVAAQASA